MSERLTILVGPADTNAAVPLEYLHTELLDTRPFGHKEAPRVSDVEFDPETQEWVARLLDGCEIARDVSRDQVIRAERRIITDMAMRGEKILTKESTHGN